MSSSNILVESAFAKTEPLKSEPDFLSIPTLEEIK